MRAARIGLATPPERRTSVLRPSTIASTNVSPATTSAGKCMSRLIREIATQGTNAVVRAAPRAAVTGTRRRSSRTSYGRWEMIHETPVRRRCVRYPARAPHVDAGNRLQHRRKDRNDLRQPRAAMRLVPKLAVMRRVYLHTETGRCCFSFNRGGFSRRERHLARVRSHKNNLTMCPASDLVAPWFSQDGWFRFPYGSPD